MKEIFQILQKNIDLNEVQAIVHAHNVGVGAASSKGSIIAYDPKSIGATILQPDTNGAIDIVTLDHMADQLGHVDFIKIDVEGMECDVLRGAQMLLAKCKPDIFLECYAKKQKETFAVLKMSGYQLEKQFADGNWLFRHQGKARA